MGIEPMRRVLLHHKLQESYATHPEHSAEITRLIEDGNVFNQWVDAIANANQGLVTMDYGGFFNFIREHWVDLLLLGIKLALIFVKPNPNLDMQGER